ncbi:uncharacterized protein LOC106636883 [Copidosoma floridanum]|uniref:uncharacterized protein LOC106636883 n=1 Tax=Copidosoma floridanum TaxID=29053 RepID=UPI000C6F7B6E|nr:uncharacterized protein LOC106636883 [Copidosoma floridanum]
MLVDECAGSTAAWNGTIGPGYGGSLRGGGGWTTPVGCGRANSSMSFGGSVPSLHPSGSIRSLRSQHSIQPPCDTPIRCVRCHPPLQSGTPNSCAKQHQLHQHFLQHQQFQQQQCCPSQQPQQYCPTPSHYLDCQNGAYVHPGHHHQHPPVHRTTSSSYHGDPRGRCADLDESAIGNGNWVLGDLRSLHRCVPALRRTGIDVSGIRMHFYPEGGWGWLVCAAGFLALLLTTGMQLAFGQLQIYAIKHLGAPYKTDIVWIGSLSAAVSRASAPLILGVCRRGSTRLTSVIGGLVLALSALFASFAVQAHQVMLSFGVVQGFGAAMVRETAGLMLGHYFRKRREFVEMIVQAGTGVGIALFSVSYKEALGKLQWRHGLQAITGALFTAFFLGLVYRSASLYHPQRHAIVHLKNQQNKLKTKSKSALKAARPPWIDFSPLASQPVRILMLAAAAASFGLYTPAFFIALQEYEAENDPSTAVLLQTCLGLAAAAGCAGWGIVTSKPSAQCLVSRQYLCQGALVGVAVSQLALGSVQGFHGLVLAAMLYGASLGGSLYSLKMLTLERIKARQFAKTWALVQAAEALPILVGVPVTGYLNEASPRVGYYLCSLSSLVGAALLFLVGWSRRSPCSPVMAAAAATPGVGGSLMGSMPCACTAAAAVATHRAASMTPTVPRTLSRLPKSQSLHIPLDRSEHTTPAFAPHSSFHGGHVTPGFHRNSFYGCTPQHFREQQLMGGSCRGYLPPQGPLRPSKSVPEGLAFPDHDHDHHHQLYPPHRDFSQQQQQHCPEFTQHPEFLQYHQQQQRARTPRRCRDVTVIEQITTSV